MNFKKDSIIIRAGFNPPQKKIQINLLPEESFSASFPKTIVKSLSPVPKIWPYSSEFTQQDNILLSESHEQSESKTINKPILIDELDDYLECIGTKPIKGMDEDDKNEDDKNEDDKNEDDKDEDDKDEDDKDEDDKNTNKKIYKIRTILKKKNIIYKPARKRRNAPKIKN